ncbi:MAG: hypothetical protein U0836_27555 [Pirellulales bacterium]
MRDRLAEKLLAEVLRWKQDDVAQERPVLQALAEYKYDEYQQFSAGSRFIENLALWLNQFETQEDRLAAYLFVKEQLVFCSAAEMRHLVEIAYPDHIRPHLLNRVAGNSPDRFRPALVAAGADFKVLQRQCLFLGLSDGARIDTFRRANRDLSHEQIWQSYELSEQRVHKLLSTLGQHLVQITGRPLDVAECKFRTLVLLDDFSASGTSYYARPAANPPSGKITGFLKDLCDPQKPASKLVDLDKLQVIILLYLATEQAIEHLREASRATWEARAVPCTVKVVQPLTNGIRLVRASKIAACQLIEHPKYYDHDLFDEHFEKGGTEDARYGYADCGLPLVLHHNTPNNSVALLMSYEGLKFRGLFPRIQRHKEMS